MRHGRLPIAGRRAAGTMMTSRRPRAGARFWRLAARTHGISHDSQPAGIDDRLRGLARFSAITRRREARHIARPGSAATKYHILRPEITPYPISADLATGQMKNGLMRRADDLIQHTAAHRAKDTPCRP